MRTDIYSTTFSQSFLSFCLSLHLSPLCCSVVQHSLKTVCWQREGGSAGRRDATPLKAPYEQLLWNVVRVSFLRMCVRLVWTAANCIQYMAFTLQRAQSKTGYIRTHVWRWYSLESFKVVFQVLFNNLLHYWAKSSGTKYKGNVCIFFFFLLCLLCRQLKHLEVESPGKMKQCVSVALSKHFFVFLNFPTSPT